jgi:hypothetical protein
VAEVVSELLVRFSADISFLKTELEKAKAETRKWGRINAQETRNLQLSFKKLKEPISNVAQLANSMGTAFGGAASKATGLVNGLVSSFAAGGAVGIAIGAVTGLVSVLATKYTEAGKAAEDAAAKAEDAAERERTAIADKLKALEVELRTKILISQGLDPVAAQAATGLEEAKRQAQELQAAAEKAAAAAREAAAPSGLQAGILRSIGGDVPDFDPESEEGRKAVEARKAAAKAVRQVEVLATLEALRREIETNEKRKKAAEKTADEIAKYETEQREKALNLAVARIKEFEDARVEIAAESGDRVLDEEDAFQKALAEARAIAAARQLEIDRGFAEAQAEAQAQNAERAKAEASALQAVGHQFADTIGSFVGSLVEGFASLGDFAKSAKRLVLGLVADLIKAVVVASILSALFGGTPAALGGVGGLTGVIGKGLGFQGFASGGQVGSTDTVPAMLTPGEYVMPVDAVRAFGVDFMDRVRRAGKLGFAAGGLVRGGTGSGPSSVTIYSQSFDTPAIARNAGRLDTVNTRRINSRQGALFQETLRRNLRG